jgi:hypothetical protein
MDAQLRHIIADGMILPTRPHLGGREGGRDIGLTDGGKYITGSWEIAAARRRRRSVEGKQGRSLPASTGRDGVET